MENRHTWRLIAGLTLAVATQANAQTDLNGVGYDRGDPKAPVTVIEFGDFGCTSCGHFARETLPRVRAEFVAKGKVVWKYVPFVSGQPNGAEAARAAECAGEQQAFWPMHDRLFHDQGRWLSERDPAKVFAIFAREIGLDVARYGACYRDNHGRSRTERNNKIAQQLRVRATPTFFINGRVVQGAPPFEMFRELLASASR